MQVNLLQEDRAIGDVFIDHRSRGHLGDIPLELNDLAAQNPLIIGMGVRKRYNTLHRHLKTGAIDKVDGKIGVGHKRTLSKMRVRVNQARHNKLIAKVAHLSIGPDKSVEVLIFAARNNSVTRDSNAALERCQPVTSEHSIAFDD